ncbi:phostensin-like [Rhincodon typus]|uniref:phostensin-like n=1 Tax=Rhincodon typus TaxID=259920 RepID=UPI00202E8B31|nr:phostensin-like [Rhincodon typus]
MTSPPQWKIQLLERKRRDEEEGRRKEKEEQERLARIPAWKREIIERRRARLCPGTSPLEIQAEGQAGSSPMGSAAKTGTDGMEPEACVAVATDSVVLRENIGPLRQNHFIQREKQRKGGSELEQAPLGVPGTEVTCHTPGVTIIQADDMTIIESGPRLPGTGEKLPSVNGLPGQQGTCRPDLRSPLSRSVEDLNSFGKCRAEVGEEGPGRGRVSRLLCRFGQRGRTWVAGVGGGEDEAEALAARPSRSRSTENILERPGRSGAPSAPPRSPHAPRRGRRPQSRSPPTTSPPRTVSTSCSRFEARLATETPGRAGNEEEAQPARPGSRGMVGEGGGGGRPRPGSVGSGRRDPDSGPGVARDGKAEPREAQALVDGQAAPSKQQQQEEEEAEASVLLPHPPSPSDVNTLGSSRPQQPVSVASSSCAEQAPAASCVPAVATAGAATDRRRTGEAGPQGGTPELGPDRAPFPEPRPDPDTSRGGPSSNMSRPQPPTVGPREARLPAFPVRASYGGGGGGVVTQETEGANDGGRGRQGTLSPVPSRPGPGAASEDGEGRLRPTFSPGPQRKSGRTITINPRKMAANKTPSPGNATTTENGISGTPPAGSPAAPAKKRYPTAEEIQVIGGYLTLQRSCLVKSGVSRGKVRGTPRGGGDGESGNGALPEGGRWRRAEVGIV